MEKGILKTLAYYDIFNFPLKAWEVHKWLTSSSASLKQVEKKLKKLKLEKKIDSKGDFWFLPSRKNLVKDREKREEVSQSHLKTARAMSLVFKTIPWIKLVGISGSLAMMGSRDKDDIDLFIVTEKNRIWLTRLLLVMVTNLVGLRRKRREKLSSAAGKLCINLILEDDNLAQSKKNIYVAHEVLQMRLLWERDDLYSYFLHTNDWVFKLLPNWKSNNKMDKNFLKNRDLEKITRLKTSENSITDQLEKLAEKLQLKIMNKPSGEEKIESGALYFHPEDKGKKILEEYQSRLKKILLS